MESVCTASRERIAKYPRILQAGYWTLDTLKLPIMGIFISRLCFWSISYQHNTGCILGQGGFLQQKAMSREVLSYEPLASNDPRSQGNECSGHKRRDLRSAAWHTLWFMAFITQSHVLCVVNSYHGRKIPSHSGGLFPLSDLENKG